MAISIHSLVPELQPYARELVRIAGENRLEPRITSARRSLQEQRDLYDRFLRGANPFPVAPPGTSAHETGEAFDILVTPVDYLPALGELWTSWGGQWGGNKDPVHFQLPGAPSPELLVKTKSFAAKTEDFVLGLAPGYGEVALVASLLRLFPGLKKSWILEWLDEPSSHPELQFLQEVIGLL